MDVHHVCENKCELSQRLLLSGLRKYQSVGPQSRKRSVESTRYLADAVEVGREAGGGIHLEELPDDEKRVRCPARACLAHIVVLVVEVDVVYFQVILTTFHEVLASLGFAPVYIGLS